MPAYQRLFYQDDREDRPRALRAVRFIFSPRVPGRRGLAPDHSDDAGRLLRAEAGATLTSSAAPERSDAAAAMDGPM